MSYIVIKEFAHINRKYKVGENVSFGEGLMRDLKKKQLIAKKEVKAIKPEPKKKRGRPSKKNK